jgi:hypothetical protein
MFDALIINEIVKFLPLKYYLETRLVFREHPGTRISELVHRYPNIDDRYYLADIGCNNTYVQRIEDLSSVDRYIFDVDAMVYYRKHSPQTIKILIVIILWFILFIQIPLAIGCYCVVIYNNNTYGELVIEIITMIIFPILMDIALMIMLITFIILIKKEETDWKV